MQYAKFIGTISRILPGLLVLRRYRESIPCAPPVPASSMSIRCARLKISPGNFQDYEKDKMRRLGQDSIIPHRVKYKKLTR